MTRDTFYVLFLEQTPTNIYLQTRSISALLSGKIRCGSFNNGSAIFTQTS